MYQTSMPYTLTYKRYMSIVYLNKAGEINLKQ